MTSISVRLPDGKRLEFPSGVSVLEVAQRIGPGLAKAALAGRIDGALVDLRKPLDQDTALEIVTTKDPAGVAWGGLQAPFLEPFSQHIEGRVHAHAWFPGCQWVEK